jgi:spore coat polysaccharide biosynthesis predicted glycosyltransferase SpsG
MQKTLLVCYVSSEIGIGHLSRLLALADTLKKDNKVIPEFLIFGNLIKKNELENFKVHNFSLDDDFVEIIKSILEISNFDLIIFDIYQNHKIRNFSKLFLQLKKCNICTISIDSLIEHCDTLDLIWIPSFNFDHSKHVNCKSLLKSGWDSYLIQKRFQQKRWSPGSKVLVLTGGSDIANLGKTLPSQLDQILNNNSELHWVKGPLSKDPSLPKKRQLNWIIHDAPQHLDELIIQSNYVITVFGLSFFEVMQYGVPTVVFSPYNNKDKKDLEALTKEEVAMVANNSKSAVEGLFKLMNNDEIASKYSINALKKMSINGTKNLSREISSLLNVK